MASLIYALATDGTWDVHAAGCRDIPRAQRTRFQELPVPFDADSVSEAREIVCDDECVELGYSPDHDVNILPCAATALGE